MLKTKQHTPSPSPFCATLILWFRLLSWVTNSVQWNQGVCLSFFFATYTFKGTCFLFQISTDNALWEDAGTHFANVSFFFLSFAWSLCHNVSCCCLLSFYEVPNVSSRKFIYASQVTLRPQNHLMINRLSLGAYLIDILWNVMPVLQKLNSFVLIYCCLQCTAWFYLIECYCLIFSSYRRDHALLYDMF